VSELGAQRHLARERALELLYEATIKERPVATILEELPVSPDAYAIALVNAATLRRERAHQLISAYAIDWPLERIALIDRLVMELAVGELLMEDAPPRAVVLDEAVEIAKTYSGDNAPYFVNGVLTAIADELGA